MADLSLCLSLYLFLSLFLHLFIISLSLNVYLTPYSLIPPPLFNPFIGPYLVFIPCVDLRRDMGMGGKLLMTDLKAWEWMG